MMLIPSSASFPVLGQLINNGLFLCLVAEARSEVLLHMYNVISFYLILSTMQNIFILFLFILLHILLFG